MVRVVPVLLVHTAVVVWLTWPLGATLGTRVMFRVLGSDGLFTTWVLAWQSHALAHAPARWFDGNIFHPAPRALFYGPMGLGALPLFAPPFLATGNPILAANLTFLSGVVLTATALHLVVRAWTGSHAPGMIAAAAFLGTRWTLQDWIPGPYHWSALFCFPFLVLLAARRTLETRAILLLAALIAMQCLTELVYIAPAVLAPLGVLTLARLLRRRTRADGLRLAAAIAIAMLALSPLYVGYRAVRAGNPGLETAWPVAQKRTELPWGLFGAWPKPLSWVDAPPPAALPPVAFALVLLGAGSVAQRSWRGGARRARRLWAHGLLWTVVGLAISISPTFNWYGQPRHFFFAPMLERLGVYEVVRVPARLAVAALIGLAILTGLGFAECARRLQGLRILRPVGSILPAVLAAFVGGALYLQYAPALGVPAWLNREPLPDEYPLQDAPPRDSPLLAAITATEGALLELPATANPGVNALAMYRSLAHWRPILNGYSSYWPPGFTARLALATQLPDPAALAALRRDTGLTRILVHLDVMRKGRAGAVWDRLATNGGGSGLRLITRDRDDALFAVDGP
jgi:hypothetical protein